MSDEDEILDSANALEAMAVAAVHEGLDADDTAYDFLAAVYEPAYGELPDADNIDMDHYAEQIGQILLQYRDLASGVVIPVPASGKHAQAMLRVAQKYIDDQEES